MENEVMNNVELDDVIEVFQDNNRGNGFGWGVIGCLLVTVAVGVAVFAKKKIDAKKANKSEGVLKFEEIENETKDEEVTVE